MPVRQAFRQLHWSSPRRLRPRTTTTTRPTQDRLHQPTPKTHRHPLNAEPHCLTKVDRAQLILLLLVGFLLLPIVLLAWFVMPIIAGIKANDGTDYRYPLALRLLS